MPAELDECEMKMAGVAARIVTATSFRQSSLRNFVEILYTNDRVEYIHDDEWRCVFRLKLRERQRLIAKAFYNKNSEMRRLSANTRRE